MDSSILERAKQQAVEQAIASLGSAVEKGRHALRESNGNLLAHFELELLVNAAAERHAELAASLK